MGDDGYELVFVYGTLRKGASNHFRMEGADCLGKAVVTGELYRIDWYPGVILCQEGPLVHGEIYRVRPALLAQLDRFEGIRGATGDEYARVRALAHADAGRPVEVWVYEYRGRIEKDWRMSTGDWADA